MQHHRSLRDYALVGGEPTQTNSIRQSDGRVYEYPFAELAQLAPAFYDDLEQCHVAVLNTHGGQINGRYRFRRGYDVWVEFRPPMGRGLGSGDLRHLFLEGCSGLTYQHPPSEAVLLSTWMQSAMSDGVATICGVDGEYVALDRNGWRFFGRYHKGDSISDAWGLGIIDECERNAPATTAFGATRGAALETLLDGRFAPQRAEAHWAAASVWITW